MSLSLYASEEKLIAALRRGEAKAYDYLYRDCRPMVINLIRTNSGVEEEAVDLLQEAMIVLFRNLQKADFVLTSKVKTYIYSICQNKWLYQLRQRNQPKININEFEEVIAEESQEANYPLTDQQLRQAINRLNEKCRLLLIYFYYNEQSLEEITHLLNFDNVNATKVRKFRCMQRLKELAKEFI